ncbi:hypothetical protein AVEN_59245-1 [Araneus ventricosus]|uniref:Uncharacterized protein n=1 Tax=Araneus ventricosus TaxID=182803 RepID=A0A4Y2CY14_ARAVE|nr:hypothetical protein AVEN_59245-1 [Araneus ventricosus]
MRTDTSAGTFSLTFRNLSAGGRLPLNARFNVNQNQITWWIFGGNEFRIQNPAVPKLTPCYQATAAKRRFWSYHLELKLFIYLFKESTLQR